MSLSWSQNNRLAKELYRPLIPKLGCNRNFPKLLRYNSSSLLGLGLYDPYTKQGLAKLLVFLTHAGSTSITGKLIQTLLEQHELEIGSLDPLFTIPHKDYAFITTTSWITELWE